MLQMYEASVLKELCSEWTDLYDWIQQQDPEDRKPKQLYTHSALADRAASWGYVGQSLWVYDTYVPWDWITDEMIGG